jgi:acetyl-CoA synthetase
MRGILNNIAENKFNNIGDTSTLLEPAVVEEIKRGKV